MRRLPEALREARSQFLNEQQTVEKPTCRAPVRGFFTNPGGFRVITAQEDSLFGIDRELDTLLDETEDEIENRGEALCFERLPGGFILPAFPQAGKCQRRAVLQPQCPGLLRFGVDFRPLINAVRRDQAAAALQYFAECGTGGAGLGFRLDGADPILGSVAQYGRRPQRIRMSSRCPVSRFGRITG